LPVHRDYANCAASRARTGRGAWVASTRSWSSKTAAGELGIRPECSASKPPKSPRLPSSTNAASAAPLTQRSTRSSKIVDISQIGTMQRGTFLQGSVRAGPLVMGRAKLKSGTIDVTLHCRRREVPFFGLAGDAWLGDRRGACEQNCCSAITLSVCSQSLGTILAHGLFQVAHFTALVFSRWPLETDSDCSTLVSVTDWIVCCFRACVRPAVPSRRRPGL
jgi:hypothetical protein